MGDIFQRKSKCKCFMKLGTTKFLRAKALGDAPRKQFKVYRTYK